MTPDIAICPSRHKSINFVLPGVNRKLLALRCLSTRNLNGNRSRCTCSDNCTYPNGNDLCFKSDSYPGPCTILVSNVRVTETDVLKMLGARYCFELYRGFLYEIYPIMVLERKML